MKRLTMTAAALALAACGTVDGTTTEELGAGGGTCDQGKHQGQVATVMTRNLYLGADLAPAIGAQDLAGLVAGGGVILRHVTTNDFTVRAQGLAAEILEAEPDLVGLQEVALWRTGPASIAPLQGGEKTATTVRYDYLALLLAQLNDGKERYRPVAIEEEFDFEAPADENGVAGDGTDPIGNAELNARLTMRDVILARVDGGVHTSAPAGGHYDQLLELPMLGGTVVVTRGWASVDARVRGGAPFRFVATHLEAYGPGVLRAAQAGELAAGPAAGPGIVVLVGDLNSDDDTVAPDDQQAYHVLTAAGLVERSTGDPLSCCIKSQDLSSGSVADFDHQVDHVMTNAPAAVRLVDSFVTGRTMLHGYWDSDHAGIVSALRIR